MKRLSLSFLLLLISQMSFVEAGFSLDRDDSILLNERGLKRTKTSSPRSSKRKKSSTPISKNKFLSRLNTLQDFEKVKKKNIYAFLIGNDKYQKQSDFAPLNQCANDVLLMRQILIHCVKADPKNIYVNHDLTIKEFNTKFAQFVQKVNEDKDAMVLITYSGHGDTDGSLVFVKGGSLKPTTLKDLVNSFNNDTILLLDACYSGNNEGPKEAYKKGRKQGFKSNSLRIYASLAHLTAKEIKYSGGYFKEILPFYRNVLKINKISGNGYFTAMIGLFFAEYQFKPEENISFKDLISYVTNKGKQYVEFLALGKKTGREAGLRLNQQPKILPIKQKVDFQDINHSFILTQKYIKPLGLEPTLTGGVFFPFGNELWIHTDIPSLAFDFSVNYELDFILKGFYGQLSVGFTTLSLLPDPNRRDISMTILTPSLGVKYRPFQISLFIPN